MKKYLSRYTVLSCLILLVINSQALAQTPFAANGKTKSIDNVRIYYEETGSGMPLVLFHGFGRTADDWKENTIELAKEYRVIAIDLPGHGRSDYMDTTNVYLHKNAAAYVIALLDSLQIDSAYFMGVSSGAFVALYVATLRPQLAKKVVALAGQVNYSPTTRKVISSLGGPENHIMSSVSLSGMHGQQKAGIIARQFWHFRLLEGDPSFTPEVLSTIQASTLIIHGDNDPIAPVANAWELYQHIPNAYLWIVPNGGHVPNAIRSNQPDFMRRVTEFLRGDWQRKK